MCVCVHANKSVKKKYVGAIYEHVCVRALQNKGAIQVFLWAYLQSSPGMDPDNTERAHVD